MNKLAIFVEGYTEAIFVEKLIDEIAGQNKVLIEQRQIRGGKTVRRTMKLIKACKPDTGQEYFVLVLDCGGDNLVKSRIMEEHKHLTNSGYSSIIGIRDVRPDFSHNDIERLKMSLPKYIKTSLSPVIFILSIMEIEAWFLAEDTHFSKIDPSITLASIRAALHFDPANDDMQLRQCPADDLKACYAIGGKTYEKSQADSTINVLDYAHIYLNIRGKIEYLNQLIFSIETFLS